jgi:putative transposase
VKSGAISDRFAKPDSHWFSLLDSYRSFNALAESIIGLYKTELIKKQRPWKGFDDLEIATAEWVDWFNHRRPFEYCDDLTPVEAEAAHYAHHQTPATAGVSN